MRAEWCTFVGYSDSFRLADHPLLFLPFSSFFWLSFFLKNGTATIVLKRFNLNPAR
jgi:hypothetical protein